MNETFLLHSVIRGSDLRVKDIKVQPIKFGKVQVGMVMHLALSNNQLKITSCSSKSKIYDLKGGNIEEGSIPGWITCPFCSRSVSGFYRKITRQQSSAIMVHCGCSLGVKIVRNEQIVGTLNYRLSDRNPRGSPVYYGEHLWANKKKVLFRTSGNLSVVQFLWSDIDKDIFDKQEEIQLPSEILCREIADVWLDEQYLLLLSYDGHLVSINQRNDSITIRPPLIGNSPAENSVLWNNPTRLPNKDIMVSSLQTGAAHGQKIYLATPSFKLRQVLEITFPSQFSTDTIERFETLLRSTHQQIVMALFNHRYATVLLLKGTRMSMLKELVSFEDTGTCNAISELVSAAKRRRFVYYLGVGHSVQKITISLRHS